MRRNALAERGIQHVHVLLAVFLRPNDEFLVVRLQLFVDFFPLRVSFGKRVENRFAVEIVALQIGAEIVDRNRFVEAEHHRALLLRIQRGKVFLFARARKFRESTRKIRRHLFLVG